MRRPKRPSAPRLMAGLLIASLLASPVMSRAASAAEPITPPPMPAPDAWVERAGAQVRVLDKLDASTTVVTLKAGEQARVKSLSIRLGRCLSRPDGLPADAAAWVDVDDDRPDTPNFGNWLFVAEPSLVMFENPVYGVTLIGCDGPQTAAFKGHDFQPAPPPPPSASDPNAPDLNAPDPNTPGADALPQSPGATEPPGGDGHSHSSVDGVDGIPDPNAPDAAPDGAPNAVPGQASPNEPHR